MYFVWAVFVCLLCPTFCLYSRTSTSSWLLLIQHVQQRPTASFQSLTLLLALNGAGGGGEAEIPEQLKISLCFRTMYPQRMETILSQTQPGNETPARCCSSLNKALKFKRFFRFHFHHQMTYSKWICLVLLPHETFSCCTRFIPNNKMDKMIPWKSFN